MQSYNTLKDNSSGFQKSSFFRYKFKMASKSSSDSDNAASAISVVFLTKQTKTKMEKGITFSWIIEDMEDKMKSFPSGKALHTDIFKIEHTKWYCKLWPNGCREELKGNISFTLVSENDDCITVKYECNVGKSNHGWIKTGNLTHQFIGKDDDWGFLTFVPHESVLQMKKKQLMSCGRMEFRMRISLVEEGTVSPQVSLREDTSEINRLRKLSENFSNLLLDENTSDFLILCGDDEFRVHRNILKSRSSYFNGLLSNNFAENKTGRIVIKNMDSNTVKSLIEYMYSGRLKDLESNCTQLLKAANMYDLPLLKKSCEDELISTMTVDNVVDLFVLAEDHNAVELRMVAKTMILENKAVIVEQEGWDTKLGILVIELFKAVASI